MTASRFFHLPLLLIVTTAGLFFAACSPKPPPDPRTAPVSAATPQDFAKWKSAAFAKLTPAEREEFDRCINEIRNQVRNESRSRNEAGGDAAVAQAVCERVNGKTIREVLIMAYTLEVEWVARELAQRRELLAQTDARLDGPGSEESKTSVRSYRVAVANVVGNLEKRLVRTKARLEELQP